MKRVFLAALAFLAVIAAHAQTVTTKFALTNTAWTDLGAGPMMLGFSGVGVYAISDATPAIVREGFSVIAGESVPISTTSHVWAMMKDTANGTAYVAPITAASGGSGGGGITSITAGTTPTSGFTAGQFMVSDGTKTAASGVLKEKNGVSVQVGSGPAYFGSNNGAGITLSSDGLNGTGAWAVLSMNLAGSGGINMGPGAYLGFTYNGYTLGTQPDVAFLHDTTGEITLRSVIGPTQPTSLRVYNTYTDASNGSWGAMDWQTTPSVLIIGSQQNGTGPQAGVSIRSSYGGSIDIDTTPGWINLNHSIGMVGFSIYASGYYAGASALPGVSCAAGTVSAATMVVTAGIVTHC